VLPLRAAPSNYPGRLFCDPSKIHRRAFGQSRLSLLTFFSGRRKIMAAEKGHGIFCQAFFEKKRISPLFFAYFLFGAKRK